MPNNETKIKHVTEHDGSKWVELEVVEEMYATLEDLASDQDFDLAKDIRDLLAKARGEQ